MIEETNNKGEIVLFKADGSPELEVTMAGETVWLSMQQMAELFGRDKSVISRHIKNVVSEGELQEKAVVANYATTAKDGKTYQVDYYNLDMVLSVGYRVNSKRGTQFRIWATQKLKEYLQKGFLINEKRLLEAHETRLKDLQLAHSYIREALEAKRLLGYEKELGAIINDYTQTWVILSRFDAGDWEIAKNTRKNVVELTYTKAKQSVEQFKSRLVSQGLVSGTFGRETGQELANLLIYIEKHAISMEEKAANLFYLIIKNRPFVDGNKRIAALLFVLFLIQNHLLYDKKGERKFNDTALIALALLVDETKPSDKDTFVQLISNLILKK